MTNIDVTSSTHNTVLVHFYFAFEYTNYLCQNYVADYYNSGIIYLVNFADSLYNVGLQQVKYWLLQPI